MPQDAFMRWLAVLVLVGCGTASTTPPDASVDPSACGPVDLARECRDFFARESRGAVAGCDAGAGCKVLPTDAGFMCCPP